jgi:hypothetical protein
MAKKSKLQSKKEKRRTVRRSERRFVSQASTNTTVVRAIGALSALLLGAGVWGYVYAQSFAADDKLKQLPSYLVAAGAILMGVTIWIGTSSEPPVRVGDPGIALEKGELRRMPWWAIDKITFESGSLSLVVTGKDEANVDWTFKLAVKSQAEAIGWIVKEALERIPRRVDISDELLEKLPGAGEHAGQKVDLEPLQVVGKRCAETGKTISYEPDARTCPRCERVYQKNSVPKKCKCGNSLVHLRPKSAVDTDASEDNDEDEDTDRDEREDHDEDRDSSSSKSAKLVAAEET